MPEFCDPLSECKDLDGRMLIERAVYGPQLAFDPGVVSIGGVAARGSALRAMVQLKFEVRWKAAGLCHGQPTSVMGLAPGEVVTVGLRTRSTRTFSSLMRDATERTISSSRSDRETRAGSEGGLSGLAGLAGAVSGGLESVIGGLAGAAAGAAQLAGSSAADAAKTAAEVAAKTAKAAINFADAKADDVGEAIQLAAKFVAKFGSIFEDAAGAIGGAVAGVVGGAVGAVSDIAGTAGGAIADLVDNVVGAAAGGPAAALTGTLQQISEIIDTVERSETESSLRETTVTTTTESEQTVTRTFGNPYLDRSLQLRFIPVFQRFEVTTRPVSGLAALAAIVADADDVPPAPPTASAGTPGFAKGLASAAIPALRKADVRAALASASRSGTESGLRAAMLSSVQKATQASGSTKGVRLDHGLSWDRTKTVGNAVHVPLAAPDIVSSAWGLNSRVGERVQDALTRLRPDALQRLVPQPVVKIVHVFAGLHVEAVPGSCVLPDIPDHLRVIVPGATNYDAARPVKAER